MFTQVRSASRRVSPASSEGRLVMRAVYVVLEPQYQTTLTLAATTLNEQAGELAVLNPGQRPAVLGAPDAAHQAPAANDAFVLLSRSFWEGVP